MSKSKESQLGIWQAQNDLLLEYGIDIVNRSFVVSKDIDRNIFQEIDAKLTLLERDSDKPISIKLNSCGGSVYDAWAICSRIKASRCEIKVEAHGAIMSAATMVFAGAKIRTASKYCTFMFHQSRTAVSGPLADLANEVAALDKEESMYASFLAAHSKKSKKFWTNLLKQKKDVYITAEQAKQIGLVDEVF